MDATKRANAETAVPDTSNCWHYSRTRARPLPLRRHSYESVLASGLERCQ